MMRLAGWKVEVGRAIPTRAALGFWGGPWCRAWGGQLCADDRRRGWRIGKGKCV